MENSSTTTYDHTNLSNVNTYIKLDWVSNMFIGYDKPCCLPNFCAIVLDVMSEMSPNKFVTVGMVAYGYNKILNMVSYQWMVHCILFGHLWVKIELEVDLSGPLTISIELVVGALMPHEQII